MKTVWKPGTLLYPVPPALITVGSGKNVNVITVAWTGIINSDPAMTYISIRRERHSYKILKESMEFVINLASADQAEIVDQCGIKSGSKINKIKEFGLSLENGEKVKTPSLKASPISLECVVKDIIPLGTHDMFMAEIVAVKVDQKLIDKKGALRLDEADILAFCHGFYFKLGKKIGKLGFSVENKARVQKRNARKQIAIREKTEISIKKDQPPVLKKSQAITVKKNNPVFKR